MLWALGSLRYDPFCRASSSSSSAVALPSGRVKPIRVKGRGGGGGGSGSEAGLAVSCRDSLAACIVNELMAGGGKKLGQVRGGKRRDVSILDEMIAGWKEYAGAGAERELCVKADAGEMTAWWHPASRQAESPGRRLLDAKVIPPTYIGRDAPECRQPPQSFPIAYVLPL